MHPDMYMGPGDEIWQEAAAGVQASMDADVRDEAYEVFVAEAARCRLADRVGAAQVVLRCGVTLQGELSPDSGEVIDGYLTVRVADEGCRHVCVAAIVSVTGSRPGLRPEGESTPRSLTSWLRESWAADESIRLIDPSGRWLVGRLEYVGADHVELVHGGLRTIVPLLSVEAWQRG